MLPADLLLSDDSNQPVRATLVWMDDLALIIESDTDWPIDHRLHFTLLMRNQTASGVTEVRAWRTVDNKRLARCRIVRIEPDDALHLRLWQTNLDPADSVEMFDNAATTSGSARRGRVALNDALRDRIRRLREDRLT